MKGKIREGFYSNDSEVDEETVDEILRVAAENGLGPINPDGVDTEELTPQGKAVLANELGIALKGEDPEEEGANLFQASTRMRSTYLDRISELVEVLTEDLGGSEEDVYEAIRINFNVKLNEAKLIYRDAKLLS